MIYDSIKSVAQKIKKDDIFSWLYRESDKIEGMIISPDTDGFISALFLNKIFNWKVIGFYDGKILILIDDSDFKNKKDFYVFIDMEILRPNIKSIGHHILLYDAQNPHPLITSIEQVCIQPNNWRNRDVRFTFETKYPFGTFHLLISILYYLYPNNPIFNFNLKKAVIPTIYINGVFKNLFNYPENCLNWLKYMTNNDPKHPLEKLLNHPTTPKDLMDLMRKFFNTLETLWTTQGKRNKGKIKLDTDILNQYLKNQVSQELLYYLNYLADQYGYTFNSSLWPIITNKLLTFKLKKSITAATKKNYLRVLNKKPVSLAVTSKTRKGLEYTQDLLKVFN